MKTALLSVTDKTNLTEFAHALIECGFELISTGGTYAHLKAAGIAVTKLSDFTGSPEILDGRVKTLHPKIHGGILARRDDSKHLDEMQQNGIRPIDLVVVNLYRFEETVAQSGVTFDDAIEHIDIGGPSMLRSAAKNQRWVAVVCDPHDYENIIDALRKNNGQLPQEVRSALALKAFERTAQYDAAISQYLQSQLLKEDLPETLTFSERKSTPLRYGENPHQHAALYGSFESSFEKLHGKELSFNNIVDIQAAAELIGEFDEPACAIIKHTNPCGCAIGADCIEAYTLALTTDSLSAFGGIAAFNRTMDLALAETIHSLFLEVVIAPEYSPEALALLQKKKDRRLIRQVRRLDDRNIDIKLVAGGFLAQTHDTLDLDRSKWKVVTKRQPTESETTALAFAWRVAKHVKSNAIVYTDSQRTLGVGAGQMSRVDSSALAIWKAEKSGLSLIGSVVASDAFFPFADGLIEAIKAGATAVIQPGGSVRDQEVIAAADEHGIAMIFTGMRHFKH